MFCRVDLGIWEQTDIFPAPEFKPLDCLARSLVTILTTHPWLLVL
jgi:hypothetical protein